MSQIQHFLYSKIHMDMDFPLYETSLVSPPCYGGSSPGTREEEKQLLLEAEQLLLARPKVDVVADAWASLVVWLWTNDNGVTNGKEMEPSITVGSPIFPNSWIYIYIFFIFGKSY